MLIATDVAEVLAEVRVLEMAIIGRDGGPQVRPMASAWVPESQQVVITTPVSYPQKAFDMRRNGRVALLYSDPVGSGLTDARTVLLQGVVSAPDVVATPQDLKEYWRELFRKNPNLAEEFADEGTRSTMDWYYLRLPFFFTPEKVHLLESLPAGGALEPQPDESAPMAARIENALQRYPSVTFATLDADGYPYAARAAVEKSSVDGDLTLRTREDFAGAQGKGTLLWHRHNGQSGDMVSLHVTGTAGGSGTEWTFRPERIPGALAGGHTDDSWEAWIEDGRDRTRKYLERRGLTAPTIDWPALAALATA